MEAWASATVINAVTMAIAKTRVGYLNVSTLTFIGAFGSLSLLNRVKPHTKHTKKRKKISRTCFMRRAVSFGNEDGAFDDVLMEQRYG